ncbi:unnamed protein product [Rotaria magnacalcarata]|uniref:NAD(P)(+)--arginine ADP-ribosyltransferase n=2 Tax=Rotaria magnacalcarata TaxID=392030 RepID=A0A819ZKZ3_9BILA|nr:unnamed protein product [Rotaria magnacalcarata]
MHRFSDVESHPKRLPHIFGYLDGPLLSLKQALQPICRHVKYLDQSITIAKKNCIYPSKHHLTRDESAAIYIYTIESDESSLYRVLNKALRSKDRDAVKPWFPYLKLFHAAIEKLPDIRMNLWRGIERDIADNYTKDDIITWWGISSCSPFIDVIKGFLNRTSTLFLVEAVRGKDISLYSSFSQEKEVLLSPATRLRVVSNALESPLLHVVHLQEIYDQNESSSSTPVVPTTKSLTFGILTDEAGNRYELPNNLKGECKGGKKHGKGTMEYANGSNYTGDWIADKRTGEVDQYMGSFENNMKSGMGVQVWPNGIQPFDQTGLIKRVNSCWGSLNVTRSMD